MDSSILALIQSIQTQLSEMSTRTDARLSHIENSFTESQSRLASANSLVLADNANQLQQLHNNNRKFYTRLTDVPRE
ncbi:hypothetical protein HDU98_009242, partial [Podochytrium sp. JEL0797]